MRRDRARGGEQEPKKGGGYFRRRRDDDADGKGGKRGEDDPDNNCCTNFLLIFGVLFAVILFCHAGYVSLGGKEGIAAMTAKQYVAPDPDGCRCVNDTFGPDCRYGVGVTRSYLPEREAALRPCKPDEEMQDVNQTFPGRANAARQLDRALPHLQNPINCAHGYTFTSYRLYYIPPEMGLLDQLAAAMPGLGDAFHYQKAFQFYPQRKPPPPPAVVDVSFYGDVNVSAPPPPPVDKPLEDAYCGLNSAMTCFLEPASTCAIEQEDGDLHRGLAFHDPTHKVEVIPGPVRASEKRIRTAYGKHGSHDFSLAVPDVLARYGMYWYHAQLLRWLWRPNSEVTDRIEQIRRAIGLEGRRCIAVFVPADCTPEQQEAGCEHTDIEPIYEAVGELSRRYMAPYVYLDTDSMRAVAATARFPKLNWMHIGGNSSWALYRHLHNNTDPPEPKPDWLGGHRFSAPPPAPRDSLDDVLDEIGSSRRLQEFVRMGLLSSCDFFTGHFSLPQMKVAYHLAVALKRYYPPFISLDEPLMQQRPPLFVPPSPPPAPGTRPRVRKGRGRKLK